MSKSFKTDIQTYSFDQICESQRFNHDELFIRFGQFVNEISAHEKQLTAAQAEIARLKEENESLKMDFDGRKMSEEIAVQKANELISENQYQKDIIGASFQREHKLQSALDVAVEGLEECKRIAKTIEGKGTAQAVEIMDVHAKTLDKIKQIKATSDAKRHMELSKVLDDNGDR